MLDECGLPDLARRAREGHFDDYFAPAEVADGMELLRLVKELNEAKGPRSNPPQRARIKVIIAAVKEGEFDGTPEEGRRWAESADGRRAMAEFPPDVRERLFGVKS
ncbi:MAG: hypothetical protein M3340_08660 [Actinomycetota bacterium]|nr:hypothetical protein [Actinomycetota bacterium]